MFVQGPSMKMLELTCLAVCFQCSRSAALLREYLVGLASWEEEIIDGADALTHDELLTDIGCVFTVACDCIHNICVLRTEDNTAFIDQNALPPILPNALVKTRPGDFLREVCSFKFWLEYQYSDVLVELLIADEHRALIMHYHNDEVLKNGIDSTKITASFSEARNVIGRDSFQNLAEFGVVIATLFPGTCTVESDFSTIPPCGGRRMISEAVPFGLWT